MMGSDAHTHIVHYEMSAPQAPKAQTCKKYLDVQLTSEIMQG